MIEIVPIEETRAVLQDISERELRARKAMQEAVCHELSVSIAHELRTMGGYSKHLRVSEFSGDLRAVQEAGSILANKYQEAGYRVVWQPSARGNAGMLQIFVNNA